MRGWFSREYEPVETIEPGGSVSFHLPNAGWSWDVDVEPERPEGAGHALYGPVEVRGARAGQTLAVRIDEVEPRDWGRTWADGEAFTWSLDLYAPDEILDRSLISLGLARCRLEADEPEEELDASEVPARLPVVAAPGQPPGR